MGILIRMIKRGDTTTKDKFILVNEFTNTTPTGQSVIKTTKKKMNWQNSNKNKKVKKIISKHNKKKGRKNNKLRKKNKKLKR